MLALSRKQNQAIKIGDHITVQVIRTKTGSVRLGITAPPDVPVHRLEVWEDIQLSKAADRQHRRHTG